MTYAEKTQGTLRLMFYNIFGYKWYPDKENCPHLHSGPKELRQKLEAELIKRYAPDVLGMQEYSPSFDQGMTPMLNEAGYTRVDVWHIELDSHGRKINFTPLFYREDKLLCVDCGFVLYDGPNDVNSKSLTWAVFEDKSSLKRFVALSTHFMYNDPKLAEGIANETRVGNARRLLSVTESVLSENGGVFGGLPVVVGGDLNCVFGSDPFNTLSNGGFEWLYGIAPIKSESKGLKRYATYDERLGEYVNCPMPKDDPTSAIDYIWLKQGSAIEACVCSYITVTDREACLASDHCPRFTDIILK